MESNKKALQQVGLYILIFICLAIIVVGGFSYVSSLRADLMDQAVQNVRTVTAQQRQAFDNFITGDRERLHSFAEYFTCHDFDSPEEVQNRLTIFSEAGVTYSVINLDQGWFCSNASSTIHELAEEQLEVYRTLQGSGVRDSYIGVISNEPKFGYYEFFTFTNGDRGLVQKSYPRARVIDTFSLSFYNDQGLAYVITKQGHILLHSHGQIGDRIYDNIFDALNDDQEEQAMTALLNAMEADESGSMTLDGEPGRLVYTYVPVESVDGWYLVSIVRENVILTEADHILMNSKLVFGLLLAVLTVSAIVVFMLRRSHRDVREKDRAIDYQKQLFDIFSTDLSNNTNDIYMMVDPAERRVDYISPNVKRVLGVGLSEAVKHFQGEQEAACPGDKGLRLDELYALEPEVSINDIETSWENAKTGEKMWFVVRAYCTLVQGKRKLVLYVSDRTQERRSRDSLSDALKIAQTANKAKSAFLSSVSHDIRTPMNAIIGFTSLLRGEADNPDQVREYTQRIDAASKHLLDLINDVLDLNKIESGGAMLNLSELTLPEVIEEVNTIIRPQANAREQTFQIFASSFAHEHLVGDKLRINQILINLLSNAVKYTHKGGRIQMRVEELPQVMEDYSRVRFTVQDNGMGMSEEYQKVIFEPFTREENNITHQIQGTGFGMAITKSLVDLMGGTIHVKSRQNEGSTFTVELEMLIRELEDDPHFWTKHKVSKMIVADDDEFICRNVVKAMEGTGVAVNYATSGQEAINTIRKAREDGQPYDLILLDWKMPGLNGLETARLIRDKYPERIPILLFTAYDWDEIEQEAKEIGISHFMPKPFFMSTFKEAIRRIMGSLEATKKEDGPRIAEGRRILVVDDIEVNRIILLKILGTMGAVCDVAGNGQEALDQFLNSEPDTYDAILMDVQMPVMDGHQATRAIRSSLSPSAKTVPVIAMTANAFVDDVRTAINAGMDAHVAKPIQMDKLKAALQQVFEARDKRRKQAEESR